MQHKFPLLARLAWLSAMLVLILAACAPSAPRTGAAGTPGSQASDPTPTVTADPLAGLGEKDILVQFDYEPGFVMPAYRFSFGRVPFFTLYASGVVIYLDEAQDNQVMVAQMTPEEALALRDKLLDMGFEKIETHTDFCGVGADGQQACIADASTNILRVRLASGELREIKNYAGLSDYPATYNAITDLLTQYTHPAAQLYRPENATLFVRIAEAPTEGSPANWPLDASIVKAAQTPGDLGLIAVPLDRAQVQQYLDKVGHNNGEVVFQLDGQPVAAQFVPWLPGVDYHAEIAQEFPSKN
jgi:hypothetical protein